MIKPSLIRWLGYSVITLIGVFLLYLITFLNIILTNLIMIGLLFKVHDPLTGLLDIRSFWMELPIFLFHRDITILIGVLIMNVFHVRPRPLLRVLQIVLLEGHIKHLAIDIFWLLSFLSVWLPECDLLVVLLIRVIFREVSDSNTILFYLRMLFLRYRLNIPYLIKVVNILYLVYVGFDLLHL